MSLRERERLVSVVQSVELTFDYRKYGVFIGTFDI